MEREAQIRQTAAEWLRYNHPTCTQDMLVEAFRCGAEWADKHPISPWISVKDRLPDYPESEYDIDNMYLVCREGGSLVFNAILRRNGKWYIYDHMQTTEIIAPDYWMPMPNVPINYN